MRFTEYLLVEGSMSKLHAIVDDVVNQMADENYFNHDAIMRAVRQRLERDPEYARDPTHLNAALEFASRYIK